MLAVETNVIGDVIILSPFLIPKAKVDKCKPAVALETATAYLDPTYLHISFSNFYFRTLS